MKHLKRCKKRFTRIGFLVLERSKEKQALLEQKGEKMKVGYIRVSSEDQNTARQEVLMEQLDVDKIYIDRMSGKTKERPQIKEMLSYVRSGDTVIVESISRFARNTKDLLELIDLLNEKGVEFISRKESIDTTTPAGKFMLTVFAAVAELERGYILDRQKEGIAIAKAQGKYSGRKPIAVDEQIWAELYPKWKRKEITAQEFMKKLGIKKSTFYRRVNDM